MLYGAFGTFVAYMQRGCLTYLPFMAQAFTGVEEIVCHELWKEILQKLEGKLLSVSVSWPLALDTPPYYPHQTRPLIFLFLAYTGYPNVSVQITHVQAAKSLLALRTGEFRMSINQPFILVSHSSIETEAWMECLKHTDQKRIKTVTLQLGLDYDPAHGPPSEHVISEKTHYLTAQSLQLKLHRFLQANVCRYWRWPGATTCGHSEIVHQDKCMSLIIHAVQSSHFLQAITKYSSKTPSIGSIVELEQKIPGLRITAANGDLFDLTRTLISSSISRGSEGYKMVCFINLLSAKTYVPYRSQNGAFHAAWMVAWPRWVTMTPHIADRWHSGSQNDKQTILEMMEGALVTETKYLKPILTTRDIVIKNGFERNLSKIPQQLLDLSYLHYMRVDEWRSGWLD
jgi:hypothetical protein